MEELIGEANWGKNGLLSKLNAPYTFITHEESYWIGTMNEVSNRSEIIMIIAGENTSWSIEIPSIQILYIGTDNSMYPKIRKTNLTKEPPIPNIYYDNDSKKIYLKRAHKYGTGYTIARLSSTKVIDLTIPIVEAVPVTAEVV